MIASNLLFFATLFISDFKKRTMERHLFFAVYHADLEQHRPTDTNVSKVHYLATTINDAEKTSIWGDIWSQQQLQVEKRVCLLLFWCHLKISWKFWGQKNLFQNFHQWTNSESHFKQPRNHCMVSSPHEICRIGIYNFKNPPCIGP